MSAPEGGEGEFTCVLCADRSCFPTREELQDHFRQHGNPDLHAIIKTSKKRPAPSAHSAASRPGPACSKLEKEEIVSCDVCEEVFVSVAKAITHKHKFHRDTKKKHFCPWCGKLFPIKHLYDKHIVHHSSEEQPTDRFECDQCSFGFFKSAAVSYHNRSFHALELPLGVGIPSVSKKHKLVNKDLVQVYFCHLCGIEFINSFNLQKHVIDGHTDDAEWEEQCYRCPRCESVFNNRQAYVNHLTYHTPQDIYIDGHEVPELEEFTLETVPPIIEQMDPPEKLDIDAMLAGDLELSNSHGSVQSPETSNAPSESSSEKKPKSKNGAPRKAITLNQFLNMNKDVFGDMLDFQGVEEIPSQVVANQLRKSKPRPQTAVRPGTKIMSMANLNKLKQQGVVVQMKQPGKKMPQIVNKITTGSKVTVSNGVAIGRPIKIATNVVQLAPGFSQPRPVFKKVMKAPGVPQASQQRQVAPGRPLKIMPSAAKPAPSVKIANTPKPNLPVKKLAENDSATPGPFSCFKKPKESLIPISDVPGISEFLNPEPSVSAPVANQVMFSHANKTVKTSPTLGNTIKQQNNPHRPVNAQVRPTQNQVKMNPGKPVLGSQVKPGNPVRLSMPNQVRQTSGIQVKTVAGTPIQSAMGNQLRQVLPVQESNKSQEGSKDKNAEMLEKLKKQGLLIKKPRLDADERSRDESKSDVPCLTVKSGG